MSVRGMLQDVDAAVEETLGHHEQYKEKTSGQSRRTVYEKALREVGDVAGRAEARQLATWIETEIRENGEMPSGRRVRKKGAEICRNAGHQISSGSWLGT